MLTVENCNFLARYLIPIDLPPEALASPDIGMLQDEYNLLMSEFKEAHKQYQKSMKENSQLRELRGDIDIIEMEKENGEYKMHFIQSLFRLNHSIHFWNWKLIDCFELDLCLICWLAIFREREKIPAHFEIFWFFFSFSEEKDRPHAVTLRQTVESGVAFGSRSCITNRKRTAKGAQNAAWTPNRRHSKSINGKREINKFPCEFAKK